MVGWKMRRSLTVKVMGTRAEIKSVIELLETKFMVVATSQLMKGKGEEYFHQFVNLIPSNVLQQGTR